MKQQMATWQFYRSVRHSLHRVKKGRVFRMLVTAVAIAAGSIGVSIAQPLEIEAGVFYAGPATGCTIKEARKLDGKCWPDVLKRRLQHEVFLVTAIAHYDYSMNLDDVLQVCSQDVCGPSDKPFVTDALKQAAETCGVPGYYISTLGSWSPTIRFKPHLGLPQTCQVSLDVLDLTGALSEEKLVIQRRDRRQTWSMESGDFKRYWDEGYCSTHMIAFGELLLPPTVYSPIELPWPGESNFGVDLSYLQNAERSRTPEQMEGYRGPCYIKFKMEASSGDIGLDIAFHAEGSPDRCGGAKAAPDFYTLATEPAPAAFPGALAGARIVPKPTPEISFSIKTDTNAPNEGCLLRLRLIAKPFIRFLGSRLAIARDILVSIDPASAAQARKDAGAEPKTVQQLEKEKAELERQLGEANDKLRRREISDVMKLIWEVGKFAALTKRGYAGPLLLSEMLLDHSNQSPTPLERAYAEGLVDPSTKEIYSLPKADLEELRAIYDKAIKSVEKLPPYQGNKEALETLRAIAATINEVIQLLEKGVNVDRAREIAINRAILRAKPLNIDPGLIDLFINNRDKLAGTA